MDKCRQHSKELNKLGFTLTPTEAIRFINKLLAFLGYKLVLDAEKRDVHLLWHPSEPKSPPLMTKISGLKKGAPTPETHAAWVEPCVDDAMSLYIYATCAYFYPVLHSHPILHTTYGCADSFLSSC